MRNFYQEFPELLNKDLRIIKMPPRSGTGIQAGQYGLLEYYCDEKDCDCRRVTIIVVAKRTGKSMATLSLGFDSQDAQAGPYLDPINEQSAHAEAFLRLFTDLINLDPAYLARLQQHYVLFKEKLEGRKYAGKPFEQAGKFARVAQEPADPLAVLGGMLDSIGLKAPAAADKPSKPGKRKKPAPEPAGQSAQGRPSAGELRQAEAMVRTMADNLRRKRMGDLLDNALRAPVEDNPGLAFAFLHLLLNRYAPDGRQQEVGEEYRSCLVLLENALTELRFSLERGRPWAEDMIEQLQVRIAEQAMRPEVDVRVQQDLVEALYSAKLPLHPEISAQSEKLAEYYGQFTAGQGPEQMDELFASLAEAGAESPFQVYEVMLSQFNLMPVEGQALAIGSMLHAPQTAINDLAVLMLLHPDAQVRGRLPDMFLGLINAQNISPLSLRRMIGMRNWLPPEERAGLDQLIKKSRQARVECAPMPKPRQATLYASPFDGAGTQGCWITYAEKRRHDLVAVLIKQGEGVREAWGQEGLNKKEIDLMSREMRDSAGAEQTDPAFLQRLVPHFIQVGLQRGTPPPAALLHVAETLGGTYWMPQTLDPEAELEALAAANPRAFAPDKAREVLELSADWPETATFASSWFEDDAKVDALLRKHLKSPNRWLDRLDQGTELVRKEILDAKRAIWSERLLWMALWAKASKARRPLPWEAFAVLARELYRGTPLAEIGLMEAVAETSVYAAWQRARG